MKNRILFLMLTLMISLNVLSQLAEYPKREFRGAWIQCVNGQFLGKSQSEIKNMLESQLNVLQKAGINVILFQVRAEGDALYKSSYEPWSRYLTGTQGKPTVDDWDPLEWMINLCHERNMECHAWINPYRARTKGTVNMDSRHAAIRHPNRVFEYGDLLIFNPAIEQNRLYTCMIVEDILTRYDVDGLHIDDYFYPYPVDGIEIPDYRWYAENPRGFGNINDWRRDNVNLLIKELHNTIRSVKPWVKFGVSPFGIYRNSQDGYNSEKGSATNGLQNYDQLYADIVLWQKKGWIDYLVPQIYWNIGTKAADYDILCNWWNDYCSERPLIIGQDVERTVKGADPKNPASHQMIAKYTIQRSMRNVVGSCQWYAAAVVNNPGNYRTMLETYYHKYPALQPEMKFIDNKSPKKPRKVDVELINGKPSLVWKSPKAKSEMDKAVQYAVYRFEKGEVIDIEDATHLLGITRNTYYPIEAEAFGATFIITSLDRLHNESKPVKVKL